MGLQAKFNLVLCGTLTVGFIAASLFSYGIVVRNSRAEAFDDAQTKAGIIMASALAVRHYTAVEIEPLLAQSMKRRFLPQSVPAYSATQMVRGMRETYPMYTYKEATLNPTNLTDRASDWEADIIEKFRNFPETKELIGQRETPDGPMLYFSRPIKVTKEACLDCHRSPQTAPPALIAEYGGANGFGWKLDEIIGAQVVSVPIAESMRRADQVFMTFSAALLGVFVLIIATLNILLRTMVIRPVIGMAEIANEISMGATQAEEFAAKGNDEIASLAKSFNRMRRSLSSAMKMLAESAQDKPPRPD
jgi:protein-histidine pros-kinase